MLDALKREFVYIWYYCDVQFRQIFGYWLIGMLLGSAISVFGKERIHKIFIALQNKKFGSLGLIPASLIGIASPLCMYGTIPIAASFSQKGMKDDLLAAFMMSSILLNPQLIMYSAALGIKALAVRIISCFICGVAAGGLVRFFYKDKAFFNFNGFNARASRDTDKNIYLRLLKNLARNVKATGAWFLLGVLLSALFMRYVPGDAFADLFGNDSGFGVLMAATVGVPLYICGGGTIPLLIQWLASGMSLGAAASFMITGPATKITNLSAVKIVLGKRNFMIYILFTVVSALLTGLAVNLM